MDDRTAAGIDHLTGRRTGEEERRFNVHVERGGPDIVIEVQEVNVTAHAQTGDEDIEAAKTRYEPVLEEIETRRTHYLARINEKYPALLRIDTVSGLTPDELAVEADIDPFYTSYTQSNLGLGFSAANTMRWDNMVMYRSPSMSGFQFAAGYSFNVDDTNNDETHFRTNDNSRGITAGLRYEFTSPPVDVNDRANVYDPATGQLVQVGTGGIPRSGYRSARPSYSRAFWSRDGCWCSKWRDRWRASRRDGCCGHCRAMRWCTSTWSPTSAAPRCSRGCPM